MEIIKWDSETIKVLPNILGILQRALPTDSGSVFGVLENDRLDLLAHNGNNAAYIHNEDGKIDVSTYKIDENFKIKLFAIDSKEYGFFDERVNSFDLNTGREESLLLVDLVDDDYDGLVTYTQYDVKRDIECEIQYTHRYYKDKKEDRGHIYSIRLNNISSLMIDEHSHAKPFNFGFVGKGHQYYTLLSVDREYRDYYLVALKEYGLINLLTQGAENLLGSDKINRYVKGFFVGTDGNFRALWPLGKPYTDEDIKKVIESYGFRTDIPEDLLDLYNGNNEFINKVQKALYEAREIEKKKDEERCLLYKIKP